MSPAPGWVQKEILAKNPALKIQVYAVWFSMVAGDERSRWPQDLLDDARVVEFWDEKKVLGTWYASQPEQQDYSGDVLWDAYLLYGAQSRWEKGPADRISWGFTIVQTRERLRQDLLRVGQP